MTYSFPTIGHPVAVSTPSPAVDIRNFSFFYNTFQALDGIRIDGSPDPIRYEMLLGPIVDSALNAARGTEPHVTAFGEIAPILLALGEYDAMLRLEQIADDFGRTRPMSLLCAIHLRSSARLWRCTTRSSRRDRAFLSSVRRQLNRGSPRGLNDRGMMPGKEFEP